MDNYLKEMDSMMKETTKTIQYLNKDMEREMNNMYQYGMAATIIDIAIFLAIVFFIFKNYTKNKDLERENRFLNQRLSNIENYLRNKPDYKETQINYFFD